MGQVVDLEKKRKANRLFLVCRCGCHSWSLCSNGTAYCTFCQAEAADCTARFIEDDIPVEDKSSLVEEKKKPVQVLQFSNKKKAILSMLNNIDIDTMNAMMVFYPNGRIENWTSLETKEQFDWLEKGFNAALNMERGKNRK